MVKSTCKIDGCDRPQKSRGWCSTHSERWRRTGTTDPAGRRLVDLPGERWLPIGGYEGYYEISDCGRVRSVDRIILTSDGRSVTLNGRAIVPFADKKTGHQTVRLSRNDIKVTFLVHILVLTTFVGPRPAGEVGRHINDDTSNNRLGNLAWGTQLENMKDKERNGNCGCRGCRQNPQTGPVSHKHAPSDEELSKLRKLYWEDGYSVETCAKELGMSTNALSRWMRSNGFPRRTPTEGRWTTIRRRQRELNEG